MTALHQTEIDFDCVLPAGRESFSPLELSRYWGCSRDHVVNLIDTGELDRTFDARGKESTKSMYRVTRVAAMAFMQKRKVANYKPAGNQSRDFGTGPGK